MSKTKTKTVETIEENRREFLQEQARDLLFLLTSPPCNCPDPERRAELEARYLLVLAELHDLRPPPATPLGDPDPDDG